MFDIDLLGFMEFLTVLKVLLSVCMSRSVIVSLSLPLSLHPSLSLFLFPSISVFVCLSLSLSRSLSLPLSLSLSLPPWLLVSPSACLALCLPFYMPADPSPLAKQATSQPISPITQPANR